MWGTVTFINGIQNRKEETERKEGMKNHEMKLMFTIKSV
jgi:hypothetical protein